MILSCPWDLCMKKCFDCDASRYLPFVAESFLSRLRQFWEWRPLFWNVSSRKLSKSPNPPTFKILSATGSLAFQVNASRSSQRFTFLIWVFALAPHEVLIASQSPSFCWPNSRISSASRRLDRFDWDPIFASLEPLPFRMSDQRLCNWEPAYNFSANRCFF